MWTLHALHLVSNSLNNLFNAVFNEESILNLQINTFNDVWIVKDASFVGNPVY